MPKYDVSQAQNTVIEWYIVILYYGVALIEYPKEAFPADCGCP